MPRKARQLLVRSLAGAAICGALLMLGVVAPPARARSGPNEQVSQLAKLQTLDQRVADIGWRLATRNLELCPTHFAATGITLHTLSQYSNDWKGAATESFQLEPGRPGVLAVAKDSPAWNSGLRPNDSVVSLNGMPMGSQNARPSARGDYSETDQALRQIEALPMGKPIELIVERGDKRLALSIMPVPSCASRFEIAPSNQLNANANGTVVQIYGRMVIALDSDDELAFVMAHELAHNALGHNMAIKNKRLSTGLASVFTGSGKVLRNYEREADRYGIFMTARAGFSYRQAAAFLKRFASKGRLGALIAVTHPSPANRERHAQATVDEVDLLIAQHKPLIPATAANGD